MKEHPPLAFEKPIFDLERRLDELHRHAESHRVDLRAEIEATERRLAEVRRETYENLTAWQRVQIARHGARPFFLDYVDLCFSNFVELHGDRLYADDRAMPGGLATLDTHRCVVVGHQKGRDTKENLRRNFGSAHPEGYRKALRLMRLAERFGLPVVSLIDTPGAYPGVGAEERHISESIAVNLREMALLETPVIAVVLGEGGSGGALGIGVADRVLILENAYYSVISPEACSAILWRDRRHAPEAAAALRLSAPDLLRLKIVDEIVPEPQGGAHRDPAAAARNLKQALLRHLGELRPIPIPELLERRYEKYRGLGVFEERE